MGFEGEKEDRRAAGKKKDQKGERQTMREGRKTPTKGERRGLRERSTFGRAKGGREGGPSKQASHCLLIPRREGGRDDDCFWAAN